MSPTGSATGPFRRRYGAGPLHLLCAVFVFAIAAYALIEVAQRPSPIGFAVWFAGAIVAHDLIVFPLYSALARLAGGATDRLGFTAASVNYVRVPAVLAALLFVVWFPFVLGLGSADYEAASGRSASIFAERWLLITAGLFAASALTWVIRTRLLSRR